MFVSNVHACFRVFRTRFRSNQHHTIGTARTIDSRGRSIFQDRETFDGLGRDIVQISCRNFHPVQQDKRCGASAESINATDIELARRARLATICHGNHTRKLSGQVIGQRRTGYPQRSTFHRRNGSCHRNLLLRTCTNHNNLAQHLVVRHQMHAHKCLVSDVNLLRLIPHITHLQRKRLARNRQGKMTVHVSNDARLFSFHQHTGSNQGLVGIGIHHGAFQYSFGLVDFPIHDSGTGHYILFCFRRKRLGCLSVICIDTRHRNGKQNHE